MNPLLASCGLETNLQRLSFKGTATHIRKSIESPICTIDQLSRHDHSRLRQELAVIAPCSHLGDTTYHRPVTPTGGGQSKCKGFQSPEIAMDLPRFPCARWKHFFLVDEHPIGYIQIDQDHHIQASIPLIVVNGKGLIPGLICVLRQGTRKASGIYTIGWYSSLAILHITPSQYHIGRCVEWILNIFLDTAYD